MLIETGIFDDNIFVMKVVVVVKEPDNKTTVNILVVDFNLIYYCYMLL